MQETKKFTYSSFESIKRLNDHVINQLVQTISNNSKARIILSGGNTPRPIYEGFNNFGMQSEECSFIPSDERRVSVNHKLSNEGMIRKNLKEYGDSQILSLQDPGIHEQLRETLSYDLSLLGMGQDGHFASIFPGMDNFEEALYSGNSLAAVNDGYPDVPRITLTLKEMLKAKKTILLITDKKKLKLFERVLNSPDETPISKFIEAIQSLEVCLLKKHEPIIGSNDVFKTFI
jgi:6-phosphogluconolactonase